jgi:hypothetical protein
MAVFSNTMGLETLRNNAHLTVLHVKVVEVQDEIKKVIADALVMVIEPLESDNTNAGPFTTVDKVTCVLPMILRTK